MSAFELTAEERRKIGFTVDQLERLLPAVKASYDGLADIVEAHQRWEYETLPSDEDDQAVQRAYGIDRLYAVSWELVEYFRVLSGTEQLYERPAQAG